MAYTSQDFSDGKTKGVPHFQAVAGRFRAMDTSAVGGCTGYSDPGAWQNDKVIGGLGPAVLDRLRLMAAALANGTSHYTAVPFANDKTFGHLGPDLIAKLNALQTEIQAKRP